MKTKNILVVAALHGDETFGLKIIAHLRAANLPGIETVIAHPEAIAKRKRFLDTDLNRSFGLNSDSREVRIAESIKAQITAGKYDLLLDIHTSHADVGELAILAGQSPQLIAVSELLGIKNAVIMPHTQARHSLIGQFPKIGVSLEYGIGHRSDKLARQVAERIIELSTTGLDHKVSEAIPVFKVLRTISRSEVGDRSLINYKFDKQLGGYPVLSAKDNYPDHRGFLADRVQALRH